MSGLDAFYHALAKLCNIFADFFGRHLGIVLAGMFFLALVYVCRNYDNKGDQ